MLRNGREVDAFKMEFDIWNEFEPDGCLELRDEEECISPKAAVAKPQRLRLTLLATWVNQLLFLTPTNYSNDIEICQTYKEISIDM